MTTWPTDCYDLARNHEKQDTEKTQHVKQMQKSRAYILCRAQYIVSLILIIPRNSFSLWGKLDHFLGDRHFTEPSDIPAVFPFKPQNK